MESTRDYSNEKNWIRIYPIYIDKDVKLSEGRKVSINNSCEQPSSSDIYQALTKILNLPCKLEEEVKFIIYFNFFIEKSSKRLAKKRKSHCSNKRC